MKKIFYLLLSVIFTLGCSENVSEVEENVVVNPEPNPNPNGYFLKLTYNNQVLFDGTNYPNLFMVQNIVLTPDGNNYSLRMNAMINQPFFFDITFNKFGNLISTSIQDYNLSQNVWKYNYMFFAKNYFNFNLISYDEVNHTLKANFAGRLYSNAVDFNSAYADVSGSFYLQFADVLPDPNKHQVSAQINGAEWHATKSLKSLSYPYFGAASGIAVREDIGDDKYKLSIGFNANPVGIIQFNDTTSGMFVRISKFNIITLQYDYYDTVTGTLNITEAQTLFVNVKRYKGTFSFTATNPSNPSDVINVVNGQFTILSSNYY